MKLLINNNEYNEAIEKANSLKGTYDTPVIFHCYWNGDLNEKHLYSILSCYYFNVFKNKHRIILWLENNNPNDYNRQIERYAEIKPLLFAYETVNFNINKNIFLNTPLYSDCIRSFLLYNYGGIWFDLDCFFLRSFDPIFKNFEKEICLYQWASEPYPNNAIFISLEPKSEKMKHMIDFIINRDLGWGFQQARLTYDLPLDILVLPCSWFDPDWLENPYNIGHSNFFNSTNETYDFNNFYKGCFCYHWHNKWDYHTYKNSIIERLVKIIHSSLQENSLF
jgi:hypothetical protein